MARIPEIVSEPMLGQIRLQWWRDALAKAVDGNDNRLERHPALRQLAPLLAAGQMPINLFEQLLEARERDLVAEPVPDRAAFDAYVEGTGAVMTELALTALGAATPECLAAGRLIGRAWAITGLLRSASFHAASGRVYLPADLLAAHGVTVGTVLAGRSSEGLMMVARSLALEAGRHLAEARLSRRRMPRRALPALLLARSADRYLAALAGVRYDLFAPRWAMPRPAVGLLLLAWARGRY